MENYEKKYRHAIEVVKKYSGAHIMLTEDLIGEMFPELMENNDEKIRTELIRLVSDWSDDGRASTCGYLTSIPKKDILEWLERQKSLFSDNEKDEELAQAKKNAYNDALNKIEYHSGEPTFDDGWSAAIDYIRKKSVMPQKQWKPEWSEEDENMIWAIPLIINCFPTKQDMFYGYSREKIISWIKSLKDRVGNFDDGYKVGFSAAKRNQWKPLGKHLEALAMVINDEPLDISVRDDLNELFGQIKQL